jgi:hypothetical protein
VLDAAAWCVAFVEKLPHRSFSAGGDDVVVDIGRRSAR